jgi:hypothetical protein
MYFEVPTFFFQSSFSQYEGPSERDEKKWGL